MRALYAHSLSVAYLLTRVPKSKQLVEAKFRLIEKTINSKFFMKSSNVVDPVVGEQIENYYAGGVYGNVGEVINFIPEYAAKSL